MSSHHDLPFAHTAIDIDMPDDGEYVDCDTYIDENGNKYHLIFADDWEYKTYPYDLVPIVSLSINGVPVNDLDKYKLRSEKESCRYMALIVIS